MVFVDHLDEVADDQGNSLDALELFFGPDLLSFELDLIFLDVVFLNAEEFKIFVELLQLVVEVFFL